MRLQTRCTHWLSRIQAVDAPRELRSWLQDAGSLTKKLKAQCRIFAVRQISQSMERCRLEESLALGVDKRTRLMQREVILLCDNQPVVYACTSVVSDAMRRDWPFMATLGNMPLGEKLFVDVRVVRRPLHYARLYACHPLMQRAAQSLGVDQVARTLFARRSVFCRKGGAMLVTEIFLPAITQL